MVVISNNILIFETQENLLMLSELDTIYTCPSIFHQLFTISGFVDGQQFPLVYRFLPVESQADYLHHREEIQNSGLILQPSAVMADFELA